MPRHLIAAIYDEVISSEQRVQVTRMDRVRGDGQPVSLEVRRNAYRRTSGDWTLLVAVREVPTSLASLRDPMERQYRVLDTVLSSMTDFAYIYDAEGRFRYANRSLLHAMGLRLHDIVGKSLLSLANSDALSERLTSQIEQVVGTGLPVLSSVIAASRVHESC